MAKRRPIEERIAELKSKVTELDDQKRIRDIQTRIRIRKNKKKRVRRRN